MAQDNSSLILEPCCFPKQLTEWLPRGESNTLFLYHFGDVTLPKLFPWLVRRTNSYPGVHATITLPTVGEELLEEIKALRQATFFDEHSKNSYSPLRQIDVITRDTKALVPYAGVFSQVASTRDLAMMTVTLESATEHITLTGNLVQQEIAGPRIMVLSSDPYVFQRVQPFLSSQLRTHRTTLNSPTRKW